MLAEAKVRPHKARGWLNRADDPSGTISIIAAMNVATGEVIAECIDRNDSAAFTGFLAMLHQMIPPPCASA